MWCLFLTNVCCSLAESRMSNISMHQPPSGGPPPGSAPAGPDGPNGNLSGPGPDGSLPSQAPKGPPGPGQGGATNGPPGPQGQRPPPNSASIQKMLDENSTLIKTISDYQNMGRHHETMNYQVCNQLMVSFTLSYVFGFSGNSIVI